MGKFFWFNWDRGRKCMVEVGGSVSVGSGSGGMGGGEGGKGGREAGKGLGEGVGGPGGVAPLNDRLPS
jgi:hypothetical protein